MCHDLFVLLSGPTGFKERKTGIDGTVALEERKKKTEEF